MGLFLKRSTFDVISLLEIFRLHKASQSMSGSQVHLNLRDIVSDGREVYYVCGAAGKLFQFLSRSIASNTLGVKQMDKSSTV